jgi:hypothetical protein
LENALLRWGIFIYYNFAIFLFTYMLIIQKNGNSTVVVTASEMTDYDDTNFVIQFKSKQTNEVKQCNVVDVSSYAKRYNLLTIKDTTNPVAADGEVDLNLGYHEYTVLSTAGAVLERGLALVIWQRSAIDEHTRNNTNTIYEKNN